VNPYSHMEFAWEVGGGCK